MITGYAPDHRPPRDVGEDGRVFDRRLLSWPDHAQRVADGQQHSISPRMEKDQLTMLRTVVVPLRLTFMADGLVQMDDGQQVLLAPTKEISVAPFVALPDMRESC